VTGALFYEGFTAAKIAGVTGKPASPRSGRTCGHARQSLKEAITPDST
jgi:hypothetical protein